MIKFYLFSIVIWAIMLFGTAYLFEEKILENGWETAPKSHKNPWIVLLIASATPIVRVLFFISELVMVAMTKEKFDEIITEYQDESN